MESRSRGLPFGLSASRSSRASAAGSAFSATAAGYGRETTATAGYGRETAARHDRFSRLSSYKSDVDVKSPGLLSSTSRDYGSSNWKLRLSLAVSGRSHHGASAERALAGGHRPADSEGRSVRSGPLSAVDDGENKRAKMAYGSRWLCPKTTSSSSSSSAASLAGSLRSGHGIRGEPPESSWRTRHFLPRPSASAAMEPPPEPSRRPGHFLPRPSASREAETRGGRERPARIQDIASSLYPTERLTSAYAQGARPKDPSYLSCARDSAASSASAYRQVDDKIRPSSRFLKASYGRLSPEGASSPRRAEPSPPPRRDANGRRFLSAFLSSRHGRESPPGDQRADGEAAPVGRRRFLPTSGGDPSPPPERREERPPGFTRRLLRRRDDPERSAAGREDDGGDEERRGAAAPEPRPPGPGRRPEGDELPPPPPTTRENLVDLMLRRRATWLEKTAGDKSPVCAVDSQEEKLRLIKERLLQEDSDEDEGDLCRICQAGEQSAAVAGAATTRAAASNPLIQPCRCTGSLQYVHRDCIKRWLCSKIASGTSLEGVVHCELCKAELRLDVDNFDVRQLHRTRAQLDYDNFVSSGLYLVVLLEFFEQRFSDVLDAAGLFDLGRILPEQMDNLENSPLVGDDGRPSIDFSDLDDDLNDED